MLKYRWYDAMATFSSVVFLPENQSNHEKNTHQISVAGISRTVWLVFLKTDMVIKTRSVWALSQPRKAGWVCSRVSWQDPGAEKGHHVKAKGACILGNNCINIGSWIWKTLTVGETESGVYGNSVSTVCSL